MGGWDINACQENNSLQNSCLTVAALVPSVWLISKRFLPLVTAQASQNSLTDTLKICNTLWFLYKIVASSTGSASTLHGVGVDFCIPVYCDSPNPFCMASIIFLAHKAVVCPSLSRRYSLWVRRGRKLKSVTHNYSTHLTLQLRFMWDMVDCKRNSFKPFASRLLSTKQSQKYPAVYKNNQ